MKAKRKINRITPQEMKPTESFDLSNSAPPDLHSYLKRVRKISGLTKAGIDSLYSTLITYTRDREVLDTAKNIISTLQAFPRAKRTFAINKFWDVTRATIPEENLLRGSQELLENVKEYGTKNWGSHIDNCFKPTRPQIPSYFELNPQPEDNSVRMMHPPSELFRNGSWK